MAEFKQMPVSLKLPAQQLDVFKAEAEQRNISLSQVVKEHIFMEAPKAVPQPESEYIIDLRNLEEVNFAAVLELCDVMSNTPLEVLTKIIDAVRTKGGAVQEKYIEKAKEIRG